MNCGTGATSGTNGIGRTGRKLWIGHKLQACASGGVTKYNDSNEPLPSRGREAHIQIEW